MSLQIARALTTSEKIIACILISALACAAYVQLASALPLDYSWTRTLEIFWQAITDKYFIVMAFIALFAATTARGVPVASIPATLREARVLVPGMLAAGVLAVLSVCSSQYGLLDYLFLVPVAALLTLALAHSDLGKTIVGLLLTTLILVAVSYVFTIFKSQLFVHRVPMDAWIVDAEIWSFGKPFYRLVAAWASSSPTVIRFSDWIYFLFFHHMAMTALYLFACGDRGEQWRYVTSLGLCYLIGGLSYYLLPAYGPAYWDPKAFAYLEPYASFTADIQRFLWVSTDSAAHGHLGLIETYAFIACMPSLHMAHETVMLFHSRRSPLMLIFTAGFWVCSFAAVLILGWHYLFDIFGGLLLAALAIGLAHKISPPPR